jgi:hypothetical protein
MVETHRGDPSARRTAIVLLALVGVAGAALLMAASVLRPSLEAWIKADAPVRMAMVIVTLIVMASGPPLALAMYLWRFGRDVVRTARFPPPEARVVQDMPVIVGDAARQRGRAMQIFAAGVGISALLIAATLVRFLLLVRSAAGR